MRKLLDWMYKLSGGLAALSIVSIMLLITAQVLARWFNSHIPSSDDISGYMVVWATYLGLAYAMQQASHIRVELFLTRASHQVSRHINLLVCVVAMILLSLLLYHTTLLMLESYEYGDKTDGEIAMPLWLVQLPMVIGNTLFLIAVSDYFIQVIKDVKPNKNIDIS